MPGLDDEIDRLYQLPLAEFTAARDAAAKSAGSAELRRLQKPSAPAWVINQLYWRKHKALDRLLAASARLRAAHMSRLSGKATDVTEADAAHTRALDTATDAARDLLAASGDPASEATMQAVKETLQALLWNELNGRLTRPLKTSGFEALAGLTFAKGATKAPAAVIPMRPAPEPVREDKAEREKREADARRRERQDLDRQLRHAVTSERETASALKRATQAVARSEQARARIEAELEAATGTLQDHRRALDAARTDAKRTAAERARLEERLAALDDQT